MKIDDKTLVEYVRKINALARRPYAEMEPDFRRVYAFAYTSNELATLELKLKKNTYKYSGDVGTEQKIRNLIKCVLFPDFSYIFNFDVNKK